MYSIPCPQLFWSPPTVPGWSCWVAPGVVAAAAAGVVAAVPSPCSSPGVESFHPLQSWVGNQAVAG